VKSFWKNLLGSAAHNVSSAVIGTVAIVGYDGITSLVQGSPWLQQHPMVQLAAGIIVASIARDKLKNVPAFAQASGTVAPVDQPKVVPIR
jgi:hypothetical protein